MVKAINNGRPVRSMARSRRRGVGHAAPELAPHTGWGGMTDSDHFVQFYETDASLLNSLSGFVSKGLSVGDACVVVAGREHREGLEDQLRACGVDVDANRERGQYVSLDAVETLSKFMVEGAPSPLRFADVIGGVITRASVGRPGVRIYGDMVAHLCGEGSHAAAIRLEELWNDLRKAHSFSLFCAYPMKGFGGEALAGTLGEICARHTRVVPAESYTALPDMEGRLREIVLLQQKAASLQAQIEERERLLVREQMARAEAESANRLKDEFLATVSHELRTPLNAIIGWSHMLLHHQLDEATAARAVKTIERNAQVQAQLIEDILDVSRVITGKLRLNMGPVDAASVINAAIDSVQLAAESKGIGLEVTLDPSARRVSGDSGRLQQVVWNLLSNAIKFTPQGGRVEVRLERAGQDAQIKVSDTGEGIRPDFLPFIFDRFRQADATTTRKHGGLGLGLSIVRHLVEQHGGTVCADSEGEGLGSTFIIRLPLAAAAKPIEGGRGRRRDALGAWPNAAEAGANIRPLPTLEGVRVLLVDDDHDTLSMLTVILTECRATVQTAATAAEALDALVWYKPNVLVSDLAMPDADGYALIGKVRESENGSRRPLPAVALTACVRIEDRARALSAGFNMFVPKPVEPHELITAIANLTEPSASEQAFA